MVPVLAAQRPAAALPRMREASVPLRPATASDWMNASRSSFCPASSSSSIDSSSVPTERGEARSARLSPEPFWPRKEAPRSEAKRCTRLTPSAVLPASPNSPATTFSSISARKLFEGTLVSRARSEIGGEETAATSTAPLFSGGTVPRAIFLPTLTPARRRASPNRLAAVRSGERPAPPSRVRAESVPRGSGLMPPWRIPSRRSRKLSS